MRSDRRLRRRITPRLAFWLWSHLECRFKLLQPGQVGSIGKPSWVDSRDYCLCVDYSFAAAATARSLLCRCVSFNFHPTGFRLTHFAYTRLDLSPKRCSGHRKLWWHQHSAPFVTPSDLNLLSYIKPIMYMSMQKSLLVWISDSPRRRTSLSLTKIYTLT